MEENVTDMTDAVRKLAKTYGNRLLRTFNRNGGPLHTTVPPVAPGLLLKFAGKLEGVQPVLTQTASWDPTKWRSGARRLAAQKTWAKRRPGLEDALVSSIDEADAASQPGTAGTRSITRGQLLDLGREAQVDPLDLFVAVMAWGMGPAGYGWWRVANICFSAGSRTALNTKLSGQIGAAKSGPTPVVRADAAWTAWTKTSRLAQLNTAFASKLTYFSGANDNGFGPLIADRRTAWAIWAFVEDLGDTRTNKSSYKRYVETLGAWAEGADIRPDSLERALFELGPYVIDALAGR